MKDLGFIGEVAPFFLKRVLNLEYGLAPSAHPVKRFLRGIKFVSKHFQKIYGKSALIEIEICRPARLSRQNSFSDEAIGGFTQITALIRITRNESNTNPNMP